MFVWACKDDMANWLSCIGSHLVLYKIDFFFVLYANMKIYLVLNLCWLLFWKLLVGLQECFPFFFVLSFFFHLYSMQRWWCACYILEIGLTSVVWKVFFYKTSFLLLFYYFILYTYFFFVSLVGKVDDTFATFLKLAELGLFWKVFFTRPFSILCFYYFIYFFFVSLVCKVDDTFAILETGLTHVYRKVFSRLCKQVAAQIK